VHRNRVQKKKNQTSSYDLDIPITKSKLQDAYSMSYFYRPSRSRSDRSSDRRLYRQEDLKLTVEHWRARRSKRLRNVRLHQVKPTSSFNGAPQKKRRDDRLDQRTTRIASR